MKRYRIPVWKTAPFARLLMPLIGGILVQYYFQVDVRTVVLLLSAVVTGFFIFQLLSVSKQFTWQQLHGILLMMILLSSGMLLAWNKDIRHSPNWYGNHFADSSALIVRIDEPPIQTAKSVKISAEVKLLQRADYFQPTIGRIYLYLKQEPASLQLQYGQQLVFRKRPQEIRSGGNPAAFNYARYAAFQQVFQTCYLQENDWVLYKEEDHQPLKEFVYQIKSRVINTLNTHFGSDKKILGIAEALLIGYKQDLDQDLVQAYSNAGVVHIIAISGLHLGLIYLMLTWLVAQIPFVKNQKLVGTCLVLAALWLFSLITGASASVLRSAVMFTCIIIGKNFFTQASLYNSLAASAFILLCYDPYLLWDVGFQLSYLAVIGISTLQKPFVSILSIRNKYLFKVWEMFAVTLAAQVATLPVCLYYFHQFPNIFFITNLVAVPASTLILFIEIFIVVFSFIPVLTNIAGSIAGWMIHVMNEFIVACNKLPFALWDNIPATVATTVLLYLFLILMFLAYKERNARYLLGGLFCLSIFTGCHAVMAVHSSTQNKVVVYNCGKSSAIDFISGNSFYLLGDSRLVSDPGQVNFHLRPSRIFFQALKHDSSLHGLSRGLFTFSFAGKTIIRINGKRSFKMPSRPVLADVLILSNNPSIKIPELVKIVQPKIIVFDSSNSLWKIAGWKTECIPLALPNFSVPAEGAFVWDVD